MQFPNKINRISDYFFSPVNYFEYQFKNNLSWVEVILGLSICILFHAICLIIFTEKVISGYNTAIRETGNEFQLDLISSYGVVFFGSINTWIIWFLYIPFLICIDVIFKNGKEYSKFVRVSLTSFYSMIPYLILILILVCNYRPKIIYPEENNNFYYIISWTQEVSREISNQLIPTLIRNFEYFFDIWLITLISASYKAFSKNSYSFCCACGIAFLVIIFTSSKVI